MDMQGHPPESRVCGPLPHVWLRRATTLIRRRTHDRIVRQLAREKVELFAVIREQNDRLMLLSGRPFSPSPLDMHAIETEEPDGDEDLAVQIGQLPDDLGNSW